MQTARFRAMGTDITVLLVDAPADAAERAAVELERLEAKWSRFRPASELCTLNAAAPNPVVVSPETFTVVELAVAAWRATDGLYDPSVLAAVVAAGYDRDFERVAREGAGPAGPAARPAPGCAGVELDPTVRTVRLPAGVALDLGGIGKGYAADLVAAKLVSVGARGVLVNLGGDLRAMGESPDELGWIVEVDDPLRTGAAGVLALATGAIATTTRLRRAWTRDGTTLHHVIDPRTGEPARSGLASVTIVAGDAWKAEVLAKAAFVAGARDGAEIVSAAGSTGLLVHDDGRVDELDGLAAFRA
jgi:thiamine biosynthesis lipoprotein